MSHMMIRVIAACALMAAAALSAAPVFYDLGQAMVGSAVTVGVGGA